MNYRHIYHAGNFADVFKHVLLVQAVRHLQTKPAPLVVIDTHAGIGRYDLTSDQASRTGEAAGGIARLQGVSGLPPAVVDYLALVGQAGAEPGEGRVYPGSPWLMQALLRPTDRLLLAELHPEDARSLEIVMGRDRRVRITAGDGYGALKGWLPPRERRGLVLIDPPFEQPGEFTRLHGAVIESLRRWRTGTYAIWFPIKDWLESETFLASLAEIPNLPPTWVATLMIRPMVPGLARLDGCGMVFINPPWGVTREAETLLPALATVLGEAGDGKATGRWVVGETAADH